MDHQERRGETFFTANGVQIRVLDAKSLGGITKIIEPNGEMSVFSDRTRKKELLRIASSQEKLSTQLDYSYHRIRRFLHKRFGR